MYIYLYYTNNIFIYYIYIFFFVTRLLLVVLTTSHVFKLLMTLSNDCVELCIHTFSSVVGRNFGYLWYAFIAFGAPCCPLSAPGGPLDALGLQLCTNWANCGPQVNTLMQHIIKLLNMIFIRLLSGNVGRQ